MYILQAFGISKKVVTYKCYLCQPNWNEQSRPLGTMRWGLYVNFISLALIRWHTLKFRTPKVKSPDSLSTRFANLVGAWKAITSKTKIVRPDWTRAQELTRIWEIPVTDPCGWYVFSIFFSRSIARGWATNHLLENEDGGNSTWNTLGASDDHSQTSPHI